MDLILMNRRRIMAVTLLILVVALLAHGSNAAFIRKFRFLAGNEPKKEAAEILSSPNPLLSATPSPSPVEVDISSKVSPGPAPVPAPTYSTAGETCDMSSDKCHDRKNMSACLLSTSASQEQYLLVQNDGESVLKVNITGLLVSFPFIKITLAEHQVKKISFTVAGGNASIVLNAGNGDCIIEFESRVSGGYFPYATPINGTYLVALTALIIGGTWACYKWGKRGRLVDGVSYQELEMGRSESFSAIKVETAEGWDEGWDDDNLDEDKAVKPPDGNHVGNISANGLSSRSSNKDGWGRDWDD